MSRLPAVVLRLLPLALLPLASAAWADTDIDQTRPLAAGARVEINNVKGSIEVSAWDRQEVHVGGTLGEGVEELVLRGDRERLLIEVDYPDQGGWFGGGSGGGASHLVVRVPRAVELDIESVSADIAVQGTDGKRLQVESVSGDIRIDAGAEKVQVQSVSGDQELRIATASLDVESVSGDVRVRGALRGRVEGETVSGTLHIDAGNVALDAINASTVSGNVEITAALAARGRVQVEALSGDVTLQFPATLSARIEASSFSGSIRSDAGTPVQAQYGPGTSLEATAGDGQGTVELETFSGDIRLRLR